MASASSTALSLSSSSTFVDHKALARQKPLASSPQCLTLPPLTFQSQIRPSMKTLYYQNMARNVVVMATGTEASTEVVARTTETPTELVTTTTETPEITKIVQEAWDRVEDKYAVSTLALVVVVALWGSTGIISAIDRLPLIPVILELVGIGYTAWFAYKNLIFKPDRQGSSGAENKRHIQRNNRKQLKWVENAAEMRYEIAMEALQVLFSNNMRIHLLHRRTTGVSVHEKAHILKILQEN
ncbi:Protein CURVATURE THYLAKOID 1B [Hibiscus syriacus]|uniref:Protein CURVATURE THYLAKOID 1B n=1 Tax=Hibiscus syriacus TaxID=106335 RepID=A0A6A2WL92_HIBSY|nr:Protein CURVATURE THYLAKOID 1B [Hibiscus syriacus]